MHITQPPHPSSANPHVESHCGTHADDDEEPIPELLVIDGPEDAPDDAPDAELDGGISLELPTLCAEDVPALDDPGALDEAPRELDEPGAPLDEEALPDTIPSDDEEGSRAAPYRQRCPSHA